MIMALDGWVKVVKILSFVFLWSFFFIRNNPFIDGDDNGKHLKRKVPLCPLL